MDVMNERSLFLLRGYIREQIDLGKVQFAPDRIDIDTKDDEIDWDPESGNWHRALTREKNTPEEQEIYDDLKYRVDKGTPIPASTGKKLSSLINSKYGVRGSGFFRGPQSNFVLYRGHSFDETWFRTYIGVDVESLEHQAKFFEEPGNEGLSRFNLSKVLRQSKSDVYEFKTPYVFDELRGWTPDYNVAVDFATDYAADAAQDILGSGEITFAVILHMYPNDNDSDALLDFGSNVYKTNVGQSYASEREVMNLKPVLCRAANVVMIQT